MTQTQDDVRHTAPVRTRAAASLATRIRSNVQHMRSALTRTVRVIILRSTHLLRRVTGRAGNRQRVGGDATSGRSSHTLTHTQAPRNTNVLIREAAESREASSTHTHSHTHPSSPVDTHTAPPGHGA